MFARFLHGVKGQSHRADETPVALRKVSAQWVCRSCVESSCANTISGLFVNFDICPETPFPARCGSLTWFSVRVRAS